MCQRFDLLPMTLLKGQGTLRSWDLVVCFRTLGHSFKEDCGIQVFFLLFFASWWWEELLCSAMYSCHEKLPCYRPQNKETKQSWTEASKTAGQNIFFSFHKQIISDICYSNGKLTNIFVALKPQTQMLYICISLYRGCYACIFSLRKPYS